MSEKWSVGKERVKSSRATEKIPNTQYNAETPTNTQIQLKNYVVA